MRKLLTEVQPDVVIYEGYAINAVGRNHDKAELGGIFKTLMYEMGITVFIVPPSTLKMAIIGKGAGDKSVMAEAIRTRYRFNIQQNDEADAFALLTLGEHHHGLTQPPAAVGKSAQALRTLAEKVVTVPGRQLQTIAKKGN